MIVSRTSETTQDGFKLKGYKLVRYPLSVGHKVLGKGHATHMDNNRME